MRLYSFSIAVLIAISMIAGPAAGQESVPVADRVMSLDDYLDRVKAVHPFFKARNMQPEIEQKQSDRFLGREDWRLGATGDLKHVEPLQTSPFDPERVDVFSLGAGVERLFWGNGSRLSVDWKSNVTDQTLPGFSIPGPGGPLDVPLGPSTYYHNVLSATWSVPLMQNRGGVLARLEHDLSLFDVKTSEVIALENQEDFLLEAGVTFLEWVLAREQMRIAQDRLDFAVEELERSRRKLSAFLVDEVDVLRAQDAVHGTRSALYLIESQWKSVQAGLATLASDEAMYRSIPDYDLYKLPAQMDVEDFVDYVLEHSRLVQGLEIQHEQLLQLERGYGQTEKPELALNLGAALKGGDDGFGGSWEMRYPDIGAGLVFSYPIGTRTATADVEKTRLQVRQLELSIQDTRLSLEIAARTILVRMNELKDVIDSNIAQIQSNRARTEEELKLYNQGRGDLTFVIQSRDRVALSELEYAGNAANYHTLLLQLNALADELLPTPRETSNR
jgi:outer membrane protein TolC